MQIYDVSGWRFNRSIKVSFQPYGISATQDGRLYVGTTFDNQVYRLKLHASHRKLVEETVFVEHSADMALKEPGYVSSSDTVVAVSCAESHVVRVFDHAGTLLYNIGRPGVRGVAGSGLGGLRRPAGVYVDQAGRVFVADKVNRRVLVVGAGGVILGKVKPGGTPIYGQYPWSVTVNKDRLFVGLRYGDIVTYRLQEL